MSISSTCVNFDLSNLTMKERNRLSRTPNMHVALSVCNLDWSKIMKNRQGYITLDKSINKF
jgi:hypothetical protein